MARRISALPEMHALLKSYYDRHDIDERTAFCIDLAAEEIFTNMVRHNESNSDAVSLRIEVSDDSVQLEWIDHGVAFFDPDSVPPVDVTLPASQRRPGGLGLHLVKSIVDRVAYRYESGDMHVSVTKTRRA